jgi:hypothetical protein
VSLLFSTVVRELDLDTERPFNLSNTSLEELDLDYDEPQQAKIQTNAAIIFGEALIHTSSLLR